jgi:hypothetical protein
VRGQGRAAEIFHPFFRNAIYREDVIEGLLAMAYNWSTLPPQMAVVNGGQRRCRGWISQAWQTQAFQICR